MRLTELSHGAGCACKLSPADLHPLVEGLPRSSDPDLLVGLGTADDAAVYRLTGELALISTADFFTPVVDDPYDFGRIAAANALSDVYAMGARPLTALNIAAFPSKTLPLSILGEQGAHRGQPLVLVRGGGSLEGLRAVSLVEPPALLQRAREYVL